MKIKLLHNGGYRGFVNAKFPLTMHLKDDEFENWSSDYGIDIKMDAIPYYVKSAGAATEDDCRFDSEDDLLYFTPSEYKVIE